MLRSRAKWNFATTNQKCNDTDDILKNLLAERGINSKKEIEQFLSPRLEYLQTPQDLAMIDLAVNRIKKAISKGERILIYGDYDADGVCSTALLMKAIHELKGMCDFYIPNRFTEGYGLNKEAIHRAKEEGISLIITVDTGIASFEEVLLANQLNIDVIITDHHDIQKDLPDAYAVIHPDLSPEYHFKSLAGVGIAFKLAQHLLDYFPKHLLDLVAVGTIADLVPLIGENRVLAHFGLKQLSKSENIGLKALKKQCNIKGLVSEEDVGFRLGPRLNAVGRITDAKLAVKLLISEEEFEAQQIVEEIEHLNRKRQQLVRDIYEQAEERLVFKSKKEVIFLADENWHEGVLGIVASRLAKKYYRPTFIFTYKRDQGILKGSARSIPSFNLFRHCMKVRDLFESFGGHSQAAGMTLSIKNKDKIIDHLNECMASLSVDELQETIEISQTLSIDVLTKDLVKQVQKLAPFGMGNPKPLFHFEEIPKEINQIGQKGNHLKFHYYHDGQKIEGIGFYNGDLYYQIAPHTPVSLVGELSINEWNGFENVQMIIHDLKIEEWQLFDFRGKPNISYDQYLTHAERALMVIQQEKDKEGAPIKNTLTYQEAISWDQPVKQLFLLDIPEEINDLQRLFQQIKPEQIFVHFHLPNSYYLQSFPSREEFKWLYKFIYSEKSFHLKKKLPKITKYKNWSKEVVLFMLHVFKDLQFIQSEAGKIYLVPNPKKRDLKESKVFQKRKNRIEIEKKLYFSNYKQLKQLFTIWLSE